MHSLIYTHCTAADVMVFDKTGTLTKAQPVVADVISFNGESTTELLREAACLEEHFLLRE